MTKKTMIHNELTNQGAIKIPEMRRVKHIHFVGIGGAGMGGIAEVLLNEGYHITGSDIGENQVVRRLTTLGAVSVYLSGRFLVENQQSGEGQEGLAGGLWCQA